MSSDNDKVTVVILGDGGTGKSCITMRLIRSKWVDEYDPTIEDSYTTSRVVDDKHYRLDIIDTAGQEEYRDMLGSLFSADSAIDAYLLVYDISSRPSLDNLEIFDELIEKNLESGLRPHGSPAPVKMVAGNKSDLAESRAVSYDEGRAWARAHGCGFMETSAKLMVNVEETFEVLIRQVNRNRIEAAGGHVPIQPSQQYQYSNTSGGAANPILNDRIPQLQSPNRTNTISANTTAPANGGPSGSKDQISGGPVRGGSQRVSEKQKSGESSKATCCIIS